MGQHMKRVWARLWWNVKHVFDGTSHNPYIDEDNEEPGLEAKNRTGWEDLWHSAKNVLVEWRRERKRSRK